MSKNNYYTQIIRPCWLEPNYLSIIIILTSLNYIIYTIYKGKGKAVPLQARRVPGGFGSQIS